MRPRISAKRFAILKNHKGKAGRTRDRRMHPTTKCQAHATCVRHHARPPRSQQPLVLKKEGSIQNQQTKCYTACGTRFMKGTPMSGTTAHVALAPARKTCSPPYVATRRMVQSPAHQSEPGKNTRHKHYAQLKQAGVTSASTT